MGKTLGKWYSRPGTIISLWISDLSSDAPDRSMFFTVNINGFNSSVDFPLLVQNTPRRLCGY